MDKHDMMPVKAKQATMWTLSDDRKTVRLAVPPLRLAGMPEPLDVYMDFDAKTVDAMIAATPGGRVAVLPRVVAWKPGAKSKASASPCVDHSTYGTAHAVCAGNLFPLLR